MKFSFVLYTTRCGANRGVHDTRRSFDMRLNMYGNGIMRNAIEIKRLFPDARVLVFVPEYELGAAGGVQTREARARSRQLNEFLTDLQAVHDNVTVIPFSLRDVFGDANNNMTLGQKLRCARYLPLFSKKTNKNKKNNTNKEIKEPVIVRDADSIVSDVDAAIIRQWLSGSQKWLVLQEWKMSCGIPMGGGIAVKEPLPHSMWINAIRGMRSHHIDEIILHRIMPPSFRGHSFRTPAFSQITITLNLQSIHQPIRQIRAHANRVVLCVSTRMNRNGTYFVWDATHKQDTDTTDTKPKKTHVLWENTRPALQMFQEQWMR